MINKIKEQIIEIIKAMFEVGDRLNSLESKVDTLEKLHKKEIEEYFKDV